MQPRIETLKEKKLIGERIKMSLTNNKTRELWSGAIPKIKNVTNRCTNEMISMQIYESTYYKNFHPENEFEKWATVEVSTFEDVPKELETFILIGGEYAVFDYKGASNDGRIFHYIFSEWFPNSSYEVDNRPHFEILGEKYKNNDPDSEEQIWIPIKKK